MVMINKRGCLPRDSKSNLHICSSSLARRESRGDGYLVILDDSTFVAIKQRFF